MGEASWHNRGQNRQGVARGCGRRGWNQGRVIKAEQKQASAYPGGGGGVPICIVSGGPRRRRGAFPDTSRASRHLDDISSRTPFSLLQTPAASVFILLFYLCVIPSPLKPDLSANPLVLLLFFFLLLFMSQGFPFLLGSVEREQAC